MKHSIVLATLLVSGLALSAAAQTQTAPPTTKIAVIAFQVAVAQTNEGQRNFADLQKKFQPKESQLKAQSDEIEGLTKQLKAQGASLSEEARATQARTIDEKKKKLDREAEDLRTEGGQEANQMYNTLASKVYDVLATYCPAAGLHPGPGRVAAAEPDPVCLAFNGYHQASCGSVQHQVGHSRTGSRSCGCQASRPRGTLNSEGATQKRPRIAGPFLRYLPRLSQLASGWPPTKRKKAIHREVVCGKNCGLLAATKLINTFLRLSAAANF